ncbi:MauE/DoxX family redox-associated membrane protein [Actinophytocola sp.]|uniref:MauE/DoxX family redox-associated membrane protein n=1 Tax=Actinophytocola sp. TaxID=1872138 RepID=UPI003D6B2638
MIESAFASLASVQQILLGGVLLWAAAVKLRTPEAARRTALKRLVGERHAVSAYRAVAGVEIVVGVLLVVPPAAVFEAYLAIVLVVGMLGYLTYARVKAPDSSCGCLGDKETPVRTRGFLRAGLMVLAAVPAVFATDWWPAAVADRPLATVGLLVAEAALVVALSPELDHRWLLPLRRWRVRLSHPLANAATVIPVESSVQQLRKSDAFRSVADQLRSDLLDSWEEGEWRILTYAARTEAGRATAVFAVPLLDFRPNDVRVALVPEHDGALIGPAGT